MQLLSQDQRDLLLPLAELVNLIERYDAAKEELNTRLARFQLALKRINADGRRRGRLTRFTLLSLTSITLDGFRLNSSKYFLEGNMDFVLVPTTTLFGAIIRALNAQKEGLDLNRICFYLDHVEPLLRGGHDPLGLFPHDVIFDLGYLDTEYSFNDRLPVRSSYIPYRSHATVVVFPLMPLNSGSRADAELHSRQWGLLRRSHRP